MENEVKEPLDHILRPALPWRESSTLTECGYTASKVKTISRDDFHHRLREYGIKRTAMLTCMTCSDAAKRWGTWSDDPRQAVGREITWEVLRIPSRGTALLDDLKAIAALIDDHPDEFRELLERVQWVNKKDSRG